MNCKSFTIACFFVIFGQSCEKKSEPAPAERIDSIKAPDSVIKPDTETATEAIPTSCIKNNALIAYLPCPISELAVDGNLDNKKQDCLDSLDKARNTSVLRVIPSIKPFFLPRLLDIENLFPRTFFLEGMASGDSQFVRSSIGGIDIDVIGSSEPWQLRTRGWMDSLEATKAFKAFNKIPNISGTAIHRAHGVLALGVCLSPSDSSLIQITSIKEQVPLKFKRISYPFPDLEDLSMTENEEE